jgi:hypothetical protein
MFTFGTPFATRSFGMNIAKVFIFLLFVIVKTFQASAALIPLDRICNWQPGVNVGIPGGIPIRSVMYTNLVTMGADNTGHADVSGYISLAVQNCPSGQYVYMPAGTYAVSNILSWNKLFNATLRGAGMGKTVLKAYTLSGGVGLIHLGGSEYPRPASSLLVISGATKDSTNLVVANASSVTVGKFIRLEQVNPAYVVDVNAGHTNDMSALFMVTRISGGSIGIFPALPCDFTNRPQIAAYTQWPDEAVGFEDFTLDMTRSGTPSGFYFESLFGCWMKNVEIVGAPNHQVQIVGSMNLEIRGCYTHDTTGSGPNHEGIDLFGDVCWSLVEDNICNHGGFPQIILGDGRGGCCGNVVSYNYIANTDSGSSVAGGALSVNHGPHNCFNLFEGNVAQMFQSDGYFGSASDNTCYRNWFHGAYPGLDYPIAVNLDRWSCRFNFYANVLGSNGYTASYSTKDIGYPANTAIIYRLGYPNMGNSYYDGTTNPPSTSSAALDLNVENTILRTNNYDYANGQVVNPTIETLPASLIYDATPSWWGTNRWPAIDPNNATPTSMIPAQARYLSNPLKPKLAPPSGLRAAP